MKPEPKPIKCTRHLSRISGFLSYTPSKEKNEDSLEMELESLEYTSLKDAVQKSITAKANHLKSSFSEAFRRWADKRFGSVET